MHLCMFWSRTETDNLSRNFSALSSQHNCIFPITKLSLCVFLWGWKSGVSEQHQGYSPDFHSYKINVIPLRSIYSIQYSFFWSWVINLFWVDIMKLLKFKIVFKYNFWVLILGRNERIWHNGHWSFYLEVLTETKTETLISNLKLYQMLSIVEHRGNVKNIISIFSFWYFFMAGRQEIQVSDMLLEIMREVFLLSELVRKLVLKLPQGMNCESKCIHTKPSFI